MHVSPKVSQVIFFGRHNTAAAAAVAAVRAKHP